MQNKKAFLLVELLVALLFFSFVIFGVAGMHLEIAKLVFKAKEKQDLLFCLCNDLEGKDFSCINKEKFEIKKEKKTLDLNLFCLPKVFEELFKIDGKEKIFLEVERVSVIEKGKGILNIGLVRI